MDFALVAAIKKRQVVTFHYNNVRRTVEPHTYGQHKTTRKDILVGWQLTGKPGDQPDWREYSCDQMRALLTGQATFAKPRDGYKRDDPQMSTIYAQL